MNDNTKRILRQGTDSAIAQLEKSRQGIFKSFLYLDKAFIEELKKLQENGFDEARELCLKDKTTLKDYKYVVSEKAVHNLISELESINEENTKQIFEKLKIDDSTLYAIYDDDFFQKMTELSGIYFDMEAVLKTLKKVKKSL